MSKKYTEIKNASNIAITVILFLAIISTLFLSRLSILNSLSGVQASAQTTNVGENQVFTVVGPKIYKNGQEFVVKGTNMFINSANDLDSINNCWGFNTVRVPVFLKGGYGQPHPRDDNYGKITNMVNAYTSAGKVIIFEAHDKIGTYYTGADLAILKDFWTEMATRFKNNPYVWFNFQNEPDTNNPDLDFWQSYHQDLIKMIRDDLQATNMLVVDGVSWGQDGGDWNTDTNIDPTKSAIISRGQNLINFNNKTYSNVVFSAHLYEQWNGSESRLLDYFTQIKAKNLPLIIGEYGSKNNESTLAATENMFSILKKPGFENIGRMVWVWAGGDDNDLVKKEGYGTWLPNNETNMGNGHGHGYLANSCTNPTNLTALGNLVWQDLRTTPIIVTPADNLTQTPPVVNSPVVTDPLVASNPLPTAASKLIRTGANVYFSFELLISAFILGIVSLKYVKNLNKTDKTTLK